MKISLSILALLIGASLAHAEPRMAMRDGTRTFEKGLFTNAVALFKTAAKEAPAAQLDPSVAQMNRGVALFRDKQLDAACEAFLAARLTSDLHQQGIALYNAGVCRLEQVQMGLETGSVDRLEEHLDQAIDLFGRSLLLLPNQPDTRHNLEVALAQKAALYAALAQLGITLQDAEKMLSAHNFTGMNDLLSKAAERLAPVLKLGRPEAKTFEQFRTRSGQIVQIINPSTNMPPAITP